MYNRGEKICRKWAENNKWNSANVEKCNDTSCSSMSWDKDSSSQESNTFRSSAANDSATIQPQQFDSTKYVCLGRIIIIKVYSHQLHADLMVKNVGGNPYPNSFVVSANQIADNAAVQAHLLGQRHYTNVNEYKICTCSPFSPRWSF